jgi:hypothetical protein
MIDWISWIATAATIGGALLTASNLGARITGTGFVVFLGGSLCWLMVAVMTGQRALLWTNAVLTVLNLFGIWRWLGRQAAMEQGGKAAADASAATPGEALFPLSVLSNAKVFASGVEVGHSVDAMAGERTGQIAYIVVSEGGIAGLGESFRRLPWSRVRAEQGRLVTDIDRKLFCTLPEVPRDQWPAR